jgi:hypothetical protein
MTQTDPTKTFWLNSLELDTSDNIMGSIVTPALYFNMGTSFLMGGLGYNCTIKTTNWIWDPVTTTTVPTVCGTQNWFVISGSGNLSVTDVGNGCLAPAPGYSVPGQLSWFLSSGSVPCGASWVQTWATAGEEPYDFGPWYSEMVTLDVNWTGGSLQAEGAMNVSPGGPIGLTTRGNDNLLVVQGVSIQVQPMALYTASADGVGDNNPNWGSNVVASPPPNGAKSQCGATVVFVPQSVSAVARTIDPGFYGALAFTRSGYITGCSHCGSSGCTAQNVSATETWAYGGTPTR